MAERGRSVLLSLVELSRVLEDSEMEEMELMRHVEAIEAMRTKPKEQILEEMPDNAGAERKEERAKDIEAAAPNGEGGIQDGQGEMPVVTIDGGPLDDGEDLAEWLAACDAVEQITAAKRALVCNKLKKADWRDDAGDDGEIEWITACQMVENHENCAVCSPHCPVSPIQRGPHFAALPPDGGCVTVENRENGAVCSPRCPVSPVQHGQHFAALPPDGGYEASTQGRRSCGWSIHF